MPHPLDTAIHNGHAVASIRLPYPAPHTVLAEAQATSGVATSGQVYPLARREARPARDGARRSGAIASLDGQCRANLGKLLSVLGWDSTTQLVARCRLREVVPTAGTATEPTLTPVLVDDDRRLLIRSQYAAVGAAARAAVPAAVDVLERAAERGLDVEPLLELPRSRASAAAGSARAYRQYCWATDGLDSVAVAPFQLRVADCLAQADTGLVRRNDHRFVDVTDPASEAAATEWWTTMTAAGGQGMVVKPAANLTKGRKDSSGPA